MSDYKKLSRNEYIAVAVAIAVVMGFLSFGNGTTNTTMDSTNVGGNAGALVIEETAPGTGAVAENGKVVSVNYTGTFTNGEVFDSSIPRGEPIEFVLGAGQVIKGWDEGILGMKVGEKRRLTIPSDKAYGPDGFGPIPGEATLIFDVELVGVK
jgi:FKBP-type peptidyl-prolyl cis-trans isomerase